MKRVLTFAVCAVFFAVTSCGGCKKTEAPVEPQQEEVAVVEETPVVEETAEVVETPAQEVAAE